MARRAASKTSVKVNFKDVESRQTPPEGDYLLSVLEANNKASGAGNDMIEFILEIAKGEYKGQKLWFYCPLEEKSLWKLHSFLTALGEDVPQDDFEIDLPELIGKEIVGILTHETYQGKKRAKMTDFDSADNYKGGDDEKADKKSKKSKKDKGSKDEAESEAKGKKDKAPKDDKADKKAKKDKGPKKVKEDDLNDMDEDELEALNKGHKLKVDLDDISKLPKKIKAIKKALEKADLLDS